MLVHLGAVITVDIDVIFDVSDHLKVVYILVHSVLIYVDYGVIDVLDGSILYGEVDCEKDFIFVGQNVLGLGNVY